MMELMKRFGMTTVLGMVLLGTAAVFLTVACSARNNTTSPSYPVPQPPNFSAKPPIGKH